MKDSDRLSPFAAKNSQEQKEQWIWWQCRKDAVLPVQPEVPIEEKANHETVNREETLYARHAPQYSVHHGQYDAVIKRMKAATQQAKVYTSVEPDSTRQFSSGSPKKEA